MFSPFEPPSRELCVPNNLAYTEYFNELCVPNNLSMKPPIDRNNSSLTKSNCIVYKKVVDIEKENALSQGEFLWPQAITQN